MALEYVVFAGPDAASFRFERDSVLVEVDGDGELYLWQRIPGSAWQSDKHGELVAVFARDHWVGVVTRDPDEDEPPYLGPDLNAVEDDK